MNIGETDYDLHRLEVLGYEVLPQLHAHSPGYSGLRLVLPQNAAGHELDTLVLTVLDWKGRPQISKIHAGTASDENPTVGLGRIYVRSHRDLEGVFFTFGGNIDVERLVQETILTISCSAPLLELRPQENTLSNLLAAEAESLVGRAEATLEWSHTKLMEHLKTAGPLHVYLAILQSISTWYEEATTLRHLHPKLVSLLQSEKEWYSQSGQWPVMQPDLQTLVERV